MPQRLRGLSFALAGAALGGAFVIPWKLAAREGSVSSMVLVMLAVAAILNTAALGLPRASRRPPGGSARLTWALAAAIALLTLAGNSASAAAIGRLSAPLTSVVLRAEVIAVAILGWAALGERVSARFWAGAALAGCGLWVAQAPSAGGADALGLLFGLAAATSFGAIGVLTRRYIQRIDPVTVNALRLWLAVGLWFVVSGPRLPSDLTPAVVGYASLAALLGPALARVSLMLSARDLEARITAMVGLTGPLWAALFAWVFLGTVPVRSELIGGGLLVVGVALPLARRGAAPEGPDRARDTP